MREVAAWCPKCFADGKPVPLVQGLDTYLALLGRAYSATPAEAARTRLLAEGGTRRVDGSAYLGALVPESAEMHNILGSALADKGEFDRAIAEFREALRLEPDSASAHLNLGLALASHQAPEEAVVHLRRSVQLDPGSGRAHYALAGILLAAGQYEDASLILKRALDLSRNLDGLFNLEQMSILDPLIDSLVALDRHDEAERAYDYSIRVAETAYLPQPERTFSSHQGTTKLHQRPLWKCPPAAIPTAAAPRRVDPARSPPPSGRRLERAPIEPGGPSRGPDVESSRLSTNLRRR